MSATAIVLVAGGSCCCCCMLSAALAAQGSKITNAAFLQLNELCIGKSPEDAVKMLRASSFNSKIVALRQGTGKTLVARPDTFYLLVDDGNIVRSTVSGTTQITIAYSSEIALKT